MKLTLTLVHEFLESKDKATFDEIYATVKKELWNEWVETFNGMTENQIEARKKGELFTYLTTDGRFIMPDNDNWALAKNYSFDEIKKLRINIGENNEN